MAEWLRRGLQNLVPRFNSGRGLQRSLSAPSAPAHSDYRKFADSLRMVIDCSTHEAKNNCVADPHCQWYVGKSPFSVGVNELLERSERAFALAL